MEGLSRFLISHPYSLLLGVVLVEQAGLPIPAAPLLMTAGALAGMGKLSAGLSVALAIAACLVADLLWYELGRRRGASVLSLLCRVSLEPDSCVRRTEETFDRHGSRTLLLAKFVPGLSAVSQPMAGVIGMSRMRFLAWDGLGSLLWAGSFVCLGLAFSSELEAVAQRAAAVGVSVAVMLLACVAVYLLYKLIERRRFLRSLRIARVTPEDVNAMQLRGEPVFVVDLRHPLDVARQPEKIAGALQLTAQELEHRNVEIPRDRDIVLYCT